MPKMGKKYARGDIIEIEPFSKEIIKNFLRSNNYLKEESDIEKYIKMFDGNMKSIINFAESGLTLESIYYYYI